MACGLLFATDMSLAAIDLASVHGGDNACTPLSNDTAAAKRSAVDAYEQLGHMTPGTPEYTAQSAREQTLYDAAGKKYEAWQQCMKTNYGQ